jgi:acyl carrier protein
MIPGDLGRWLPDGNIEFLGRKDLQVKIRGFRVELSEIEVMAGKYGKGIKQAVVDAAMINGEQRLVCHFVAESAIDRSDLRSFLREKLPDYMIPDYYKETKNFSLTGNGKVDRNALPVCTEDDLVRDLYSAPENELERRIVEIWEKILGVHGIGVTDAFFQLGGHSLKAIRLLNEYSKVFRVQLSMKEMFSASTIRAHAELIVSAPRIDLEEIPRVGQGADFPVSDIQRGIWIASQFTDASRAYRIPFWIEITLNEAFLRKAFSAVVRRHEILRTIFREVGGEIRQSVIPADELDVMMESRDFRGMDMDRMEEMLRSYIADDMQREFLLEKGPLFRCALLRISDSNYIFYLNMHHLICDKWSVDVLKNDVLAFYHAFENGRGAGLRELGFQFKDYVTWSRGNYRGEADLDYWVHRFRDDVAPLDLFIAKERRKLKTFDGARIKGVIDGTRCRQFMALAEEMKTSLFMNLLSVVNVLLYKNSLQQDIVIGSPIAGRVHPGLADQIGCFVNTLAYKVGIRHTEPYIDFLHRVKDIVLEGHQHQSTALDLLVEKLGKKRDLSRSPLFDVSVVMLQDIDTRSDIPLTVPVLPQLKIHGQITSKYDITFFFEDGQDKIVCEAIYNTHLFDGWQIEKLFTELLAIVDLVGNDPAITIGECVSILSGQVQGVAQEGELFLSVANAAIDNIF